MSSDDTIKNCENKMVKAFFWEVFAKLLPETGVKNTPNILKINSKKTWNTTTIPVVPGLMN